jgi:hypothetical protein
MKSYRRFITSPGPPGGAAAAAIFASLMVERLGNKQYGPHMAAQDIREKEGGRMAVSGAAAPRPSSMGTDTGATLSRRGKVVMGRWKP